MQPVTVNKAQVLEVLKANRATHRTIFEEAIEGYRKEVIQQLEQHIEEIKSGKPKRTSISIPFPSDHTEDYDTAIELLELALDQEIDMDVETFKAFYKDQWGWKNQFLASNSGYSRTAYNALQLDADQNKGF